MEFSQQKQYDLDGGKIRIHRHFGQKEYPTDLVRDTVIRAARERELLTAGSANDILSMSLREPQ